MDGIRIGQQHRDWIQCRARCQQVAGAVDAGPIRLEGRDIQRQLDPLVVGEVGQEGRVFGMAGAHPAQPFDELFGDLAKERRTAAVPGEECPHQPAPAPGAEHLAADREAGEQKSLEIVEQQLVVDAHASRRHPCGTRVGAGIADVRRERILVILERQSPGLHFSRGRRSGRCTQNIFLSGETGKICLRPGRRALKRGAHAVPVDIAAGWRRFARPHRSAARAEGC